MGVLTGIVQGKHKCPGTHYSQAPTYHPIFLVIIAEHWEASSVAKCGNFAKRFIINGFRDSNNWWVRGTDGEIFVDVTQPPIICLGDKNN